MNVGLIDVDGHNFPNLCLMKISAWHKQHGDSVEMVIPIMQKHYDRVYMSKVFSYTYSQDYPYYINADEIIKGGTGYAISTVNGKEIFDPIKNTMLTNEVEHIYPDYGLYGIKDTAYGFLTRGCPRGCGFCHVKAKEGLKSYKVSDLSEFWIGQKNICLCDPNILACKDHIELLRQVADSKATTEFNQGVDVRLITEKNLDVLKDIRLKLVHFAYDRIQDANIVEPRLKMFKDATGYGRNKVVVYILTNFDTTIEQDEYRIQYCRSLDFSPYVMIYDKPNCDEEHRHLQRWVNMRAVFWSVPTFKDYKARVA